MSNPTSVTHTEYGDLRSATHNSTNRGRGGISAVQYMPKMTVSKEARREDLENSLALLAGARKRVELVMARVTLAETQPGLAGLLSPAREELGLIERRIFEAQVALRGLWDDLQPGDIQ